MVEGILDACIDLCYNQGEGCLFVVETKEVSNYYRGNSNVFGFGNRLLSVLNESDKHIIRKLAELDGAVIIDRDGYMRAFGATLLNSSQVVGHGKRHEFARGTTRKFSDLVCILSSEEDRHIRIFKEGMIVVDMDGRSVLPVTAKHRITEILTSRTSQTIIASGVAASILTLNPLPAIITITGSQLLVGDGLDRIKGIFKK